MASKNRRQSLCVVVGWVTNTGPFLSFLACMVTTGSLFVVDQLASRAGPFLSLLPPELSADPFLSLLAGLGRSLFVVDQLVLSRSPFLSWFVATLVDNSPPMSFLTPWVSFLTPLMSSFQSLSVVQPSANSLTLFQ
ncbi:MAG: hypothetical protein FD165_2635 [Gammaproteobacteria bacterium]|nr:MAG: hypothetical protein FD165_2635 [Gammaproteobacteria bacterium]TND01608.1 MAG: hypothetical protein FD120_2556 [Gammaproteobacteria bacterium]